MTAQLTQAEADAIAQAAVTLPYGLRMTFEQTAIAELALLPAAERGEGSLHRVIVSCQRRFPRVDEVARGSSAPSCRPHAFTAKAR